jgi:hypothetical protein
MFATGLMVLAVLVLAAARSPLGASGHPQSHAAYHHVMAAQAAGQADALRTGHCNFGGHGIACCIAARTLASVSLPTGFGNTTPRPGTTVSYRAVVTGSLVWLASDPALRPPERMS